jgi:hypothetical protein
MLLSIRLNGHARTQIEYETTPATSTKDPRGTKWADGAIGGMMAKGSDMQNAATSTALFSSGYGSAGGFLVTEDNLLEAAITFAARTLIKKTWQNDRDQLLSIWK